MPSLALQVNNHLKYRGELATIRAIDTDFVVLEINGNVLMLAPSQLYQEMADGLVETHAPNILLVKSSPLANQEEQALAKKYSDYLMELDNEEFPCSAKARERVIEKVALKRGDVDKNRPSVSTLYRWYKDYISDEINRNIAAMVNPKTRVRGRQGSPECMDLFFETVDEYYLQSTKMGGLNVEQTYNQFDKRFKAFLANLPEKERKDIRGISRSVFYELIKEIDPVEVCIAREGWTVAHSRFRNSVNHYITSRPLELVQIDAVHINIGLRDLDGNYIGMPVVFFAIDVFTRAILGYVISYAKQRREDLCSAIELIKCSILPLAKPAHTKHGWPLYGKPEWIQHDSGIFSSNQFVAFLLNAEISPYQNPAKTPWFNAYIERFNRTFRLRCCQRIPGYLGKNTTDLKDTVNIKTVAYTTADEFRQIVEAFILDEYHQTPHRGLSGKSPAEMCAVSGACVSLPTPEYIQRLNSFRGIEFEAVIQEHKGLQKNNLFYNDSEGKLRNLYNKLKARNKAQKVKAFYSELDISKIFVLDAQKNELFEVTCTSIKEPTSLAEYKARQGQPSNNKKPNTVVDTITPVLANINKHIVEKQKQKQKQKDKSPLTQLNAPEQSTAEVLNTIIEENNAGINAPPTQSASPSEFEHCKAANSTRKKIVKPIDV